jgi:aryl-alcohol dehydrogenase-like predicted oxidoreductase
MRDSKTGNSMMKNVNEVPKLNRIALTKAGLLVSQLAFGTGTQGYGGRSVQSEVGLDGLSNLLRIGFNHGINFWDTADDYGTHQHIAKALEVIPRDEVVILTKTLARNPERLSKDINRILEELKVDVIDVVLLHAITQSNWTTSCKGVMDGLSVLKEQGIVRSVGVSPHSLGALSAAAESEWVEVVMARINYAGTNMDSLPKVVIPILERMKQSGKGVIGMKVLGAGVLKNDARKAIDYIKSLSSIDVMTVGMINQKEVLKNIRLVAGTSEEG